MSSLSINKSTDSLIKSNQINDSESNSTKLNDPQSKENKSIKKKITKKKTTKNMSKNNTAVSLLDTLINKKKSEPIIIDNIEKKETLKIKLKKIIPSLNINFIYRRNKFNISLSQKSKLEDLKNKISERIEIPTNKFEIFLKENNDSLKNNEELIKDIIKETKNPIFEIKKNQNFPLTSELYFNNYYDKIEVEGILDLEDFKNQIEIFFKDNLILKDYICQYISPQKYLIGFNSKNISFDFNRFLQILRLTNSLYKNIKTYIKKEKKIILKKNKSNLLNSRNKKIIKYISPYMSFAPYITFEEIKRKEQLENKKKWISKQGFKNAVGNLSVDKYYIEKYINSYY